MSDSVDHPQHYFADNGMEAIDVIEAFFHDNYYLGNVFKYIARAGKKLNTVEDLKKARVYLQKEIALIESTLVKPPTVDEWDEWDRKVLFGDLPIEPVVAEEIEPDVREPRVWQSLKEADKSVTVSSASGCQWNYLGDLCGWMWSSAVSDKRDQTAPFTEVIL